MRETIFDQLSLDIVKSHSIVFQRHMIKKQTIFGHLKTTDWTKAKNWEIENIINRLSI
jgi:hypothetical protein